MTLEELEAEAEKLGYKVVKKPVPEGRKYPCTCGSRKFWTIRPNALGQEAYVQCRICKKTGPIIKRKLCDSKDEVVARAVKAWNEMIIKEETLI